MPFPTEKYQCVSRPGSCKFEWNCGPLCACPVVGPGAKTKQAQLNIAEAESRQSRWRANDAVTRLGNVIDPP